jgi:excisionase family DNA binding protein
MNTADVTSAIPPPPIWLTTKEACARARVSKRVIYDAVKAGRLRAAIIDGRGDYRFREEWIDAWIESLAPVELAPGRLARGVRR